MKNIKKVLSRIINSSYNIPLWKWLLLTFGLAFGEELILEILGRRSFLGAFSFVIHTPLVFVYNILIVYFTLSIALISRRRGFLVGLITLLWMVVGVTNFIILGYRITPFSAIDFLMFTDALSMLNIYFNLFQRILLFGGLTLGVVIIVLAFIKTPKIKGKVNYVVNILVCLGLFVIVVITTFINVNFKVVSDKFSNLGTAYKNYGFAYCFSNSVVDVGISKPEGYSEEEVQNIVKETDKTAEKYPNGTVKDHKKHKPDIIVVQLESFIDSDRISGVTTDIDPVPNFNKYMKEYPSGYLTVPAIGAGTANTEFEILTGMKSKLFGAGEYPYKTVLTEKACESMPQLLLRQGYGTHAIHNNKAKFYSRDKSYASLGFQTFTSIEYMNNVKFTETGWAKDDCLPDQIFKALDSDSTPDYILTISVQGHGRYPKDELKCDEHVKVKLDSGDPELTNQFGYYINQTYEMDEMIKELKDRLDKRGKDYVLLLYGDHIPSLTFDNNPITKGNDDQTEYVLISNFDMGLKDKDLYAYEMSDYIMSALGMKRGVMQKAHQLYFDSDTANAVEAAENSDKTSKDSNNGTEIIDKFDSMAHVLQYDMLYGDQYLYNTYKPYEKTDMKLGIDKISVSSYLYNNFTGNLLVHGKNFTPFSKILINDNRYDTIYVDSNTVMIIKDDLKKPPSDGDKIVVAQIDKDKHELTRTNELIYGQK